MIGIGDTLTLDVAPYPASAPGPQGANVTWDFSSLSSQQQMTHIGVDPSSAPQASSFPTADVAMKESSSNTYVFLNFAQGYETVGIVTSASGGATFDYSDPELYFQLPSSFGNQPVVDDFSATFSTMGVTFQRFGTTESVADGYGTLITPSGTYNNVLRIRVFQEYKDSTHLQGQSYVTNYIGETYMWFSPDYEGPLMTAASLTTTQSGGSTTNEYIQYQSNPRTGLGAEVHALEATILPNPAQNVVKVELEQLNEPATLRLLSLTGQELIAPQTVRGGQHTLNVRSLPQGIYLLELSTASKRTLQKVVKE